MKKNVKNRLIESIQQCNLSDSDKNSIITCIEKNELTRVVNILLNIFSLGKEILKVFDWEDS